MPWTSQGVIGSGVFLPMSGGTLTGALSGTTGSFSGAVTGATFNGLTVGNASINAIGPNVYMRDSTQTSYWHVAHGGPYARYVASGVEKVRFLSTGRIATAGDRITFGGITNNDYIEMNSSPYFSVFTNGVEKFRVGDGGSIHISGTQFISNGISNNSYMQLSEGSYMRYVDGNSGSPVEKWRADASGYSRAAGGRYYGGLAANDWVDLTGNQGRFYLNAIERFAVTTAGTVRLNGRVTLLESATFTTLQNNSNTVISGNGSNQVYLGGMASGSGAGDVRYSGSQIYFLASSRRYKTKIRYAKIDPDTILKWRPRLFEFKANPDEGDHLWYIAEEIYDASGEDYILRGPEGKIENTDHMAMLAAAVEKIKELHGRVLQLESTGGAK